MIGLFDRMVDQPFLLRWIGMAPGHLGPPVIGRVDDDDASEVFMQVEEDYQALVEKLDRTLPKHGFGRQTERRNVIRKAARAVVSDTTETRISVTINVRSWRHSIEMRASQYADIEIRRLAIRILRILQDEAPLMFGDFTISELEDGTEIATPKYSKV